MIESLLSARLIAFPIVNNGSLLEVPTLESSPDLATFSFNSNEHCYWDMEHEGMSYSEVYSIEV